SSLASLEDSAVPSMAALPGRLRSIFRMVLSGVPSMSLPMVTCLLAAEMREPAFGALVRPMRRTPLSHRLLIRLRQLTWAAACGTDHRSTRTDWQGRYSWWLTAPADPRTTTFT